MVEHFADLKVNLRVSRKRPHMRVKTSSRRWHGDMTDIVDQQLYRLAASALLRRPETSTQTTQSGSRPLQPATCTGTPSDDTACAAVRRTGRTARAVRFGVRRRSAEFPNGVLVITHLFG